jgi:hypothetical protein
MKLLGDLGQRPLLPGHAIACWGITSNVVLPVATLKARATSNISFAMKSFSQKAMFMGGTLKAPLQPRQAATRTLTAARFTQQA